MGGCVLAEGHNSSEQSEQRDLKKDYEEMKEKLKAAEDNERIWKKMVEEAEKEKKEVETMGKRLMEIGGGGGHEPWWRKLLNLMKNPWAQFAVSLATLPLLAGNFLRVCIESSTGWVYMVCMGSAYLRAPVVEFLVFYEKFKEEWRARFAQRRGEDDPVRCICGKEVPVKHRCHFCGEELPHLHCGPSCRVVVAAPVV